MSITAVRRTPPTLVCGPDAACFVCARRGCPCRRARGWRPGRGRRGRRRGTPAVGATAVGAAGGRPDPARIRAAPSPRRRSVQDRLPRAQLPLARGGGRVGRAGGADVL